MVLSGVFVSHVALAEHIAAPPLQWTNSPWLGAGFYHIAQEETFHINVPSALTFARSGKVSYQLSTALSLGLRGFRLITLSPPSELSTLSLAPGLQVVYQYNRRWALKPFVQGGLGWAFSDQVGSARLMSVGLKSLYEMSLFGIDARLGHRIVLSSYAPLNIESRSLVKEGDPLLAAFSTGLELREVIAKQVGDGGFDINLYSIFMIFTPELERGASLLSWILSTGFNVGSIKSSKSEGKASKVRGGLYYVFGDERLRGLRINFGFPF